MPDPARRVMPTRGAELLSAELDRLELPTVPAAEDWAAVVATVSTPGQRPGKRRHP